MTVDISSVIAALLPPRLLFPVALSVTSALVLLVVALALIFAGRQVIRVIAFIGVGLVFAAAGASFGTLVLGIFGFLIGGLLGFLLGGFLSFVLLPLAIGLAIGGVAYNLAQALGHIYILSVILGVVFFIIGVLLATKLLALATSVFGSLLLFRVLVFFHVPGLFALLIAIILGALGFWVQGGFRQRQGSEFVTWSRQSPPPNAVRVGSQQPPLSSQAGNRVMYCPRCGSRIENPDATTYCPNCGASLRT